MNYGVILVILSVESNTISLLNSLFNFLFNFIL